MTSGKKFLYLDTMKKSRTLYKKMGIPLFLFLILFGIVRNRIFVPLLGKLWGLALMTTPDGYITFSNITGALLKSPWIIPIGLLLIIAFALIALWQVTATLIGIEYLRQGRKIRLRDLIYLSFKQLKNRIKKSNWMIVIYSLIIVPLANVYETNDTISSFVIPEYIQDFIDANTVICIVFVVLMLFLAYIALRWFFLLPAFVLKEKNFKKARDESKKLTANGFIRNGVNMILYTFIEQIRLSIIPALLIFLPLLVCYFLAPSSEFATPLFSIIGGSMGWEAVKSISGILIQTSTMCFLVELYAEKQKEYAIEEPVSLPQLKADNSWKISVTGFQAICSVLFSLLLCVVYLACLLVSQDSSNRDSLLDLLGRTTVIAHKGYSSKAPENTMKAFELAEDCEEVGYIEIDVRSTKDGVPVVIHNASIKDATGVDKQVYDCTYEELQSLPAPYFMSKEEFADARIPSLEEVISTYAGSTPLLIEIKGFKQDPELPAKIVELMKKYHCEYTCSIHSGDYSALRAVKEIDPDIRCGLILCMVTGNYYDLPCADFFSIEHTFVTDNTISQLHKRGKEVYAWTVNYSSTAEKLKFSGVNGIITDVPEDVNKYVADSNSLFDDIIFADLRDMASNEEADNAVTAYMNGNY